METENQGFSVRHFCGLSAIFLVINCLVNLFEFGNIGEPGTFIFIAIATFLMLCGDLLVALTIYFPKEKFREYILINYS